MLQPRRSSISRDAVSCAPFSAPSAEIIGPNLRNISVPILTKSCRGGQTLTGQTRGYPVEVAIPGSLGVTGVAPLAGDILTDYRRQVICNLSRYSLRFGGIHGDRSRSIMKTIIRRSLFDDSLISPQGPPGII